MLKVEQVKEIYRDERRRPLDPGGIADELSIARNTVRRHACLRRGRL